MKQNFFLSVFALLGIALCSIFLPVYSQQSKGKSDTTALGRFEAWKKSTNPGQGYFYLETTTQRSENNSVNIKLGMAGYIGTFDMEIQPYQVENTAGQINLKPAGQLTKIRRQTSNQNEDSFIEPSMTISADAQADAVELGFLYSDGTSIQPIKIIVPIKDIPHTSRITSRSNGASTLNTNTNSEYIKQVSYKTSPMFACQLITANCGQCPFEFSKCCQAGGFHVNCINCTITCDNGTCGSCIQP